MKKPTTLYTLAVLLLLVLPFGKTTLASYSSETSLTPDERDILAALERDAGQMVERAICTDMNGDGVCEIVGVCGDTDGKCQIWLGGNGMAKAKLLSQSKYSVDGMRLCTLPAQRETHIVVDMYGGSESVCTVVALRKDCSAWLPLENLPGEIRVGSRDDILCCVDVYEVDGIIGHQYIDTYLAYDGIQYLEYAAQEITMQEFLGYENAKEYLAVINCEQDTVTADLRVFRRENGILEVEYSGTNHYTLRYSENSIYYSEGPSAGAVKTGQLLACKAATASRELRAHNAPAR